MLLERLQHEYTDDHGHAGAQINLFRLVKEVVIEVAHLHHQQQIVGLAKLS